MLRFSLGLFMVHLVVSLFLYLVNVILVSKVFSASYVTGLAKLVTLLILLSVAYLGHKNMEFVEKSSTRQRIWKAQS